MKTQLWCCVGTDFNKPYYDWQSLSYTRSGSIKLHIEGSDWNWRKWKTKGWICMKVEMTLTPLNELK